MKIPASVTAHIDKVCARLEKSSPKLAQLYRNCFPNTIATTIQDQEDGSLFVIPEEPNPYYLTGSRRALVQWLYDTLPTAQMYQYTYEELPKNIALFPLYSLLLIGALSAAGIAVYRRRDLK